MKRVISDYTTPEDREMSRDLDAKLKTHVTFLKGCRNHSTSMGNAIRFLKVIYVLGTAPLLKVLLYFNFLHGSNHRKKNILVRFLTFVSKSTAFVP